MFINNLKDVRDSRFGHLFVGSLEGVTTSFGLRDCLTGVVDGEGVGGSYDSVVLCHDVLSGDFV